VNPDAVHNAETEHDHEHERAGLTRSRGLQAFRADIIWGGVFAFRATAILVAIADDFKISGKELLPNRPGFL